MTTPDQTTERHRLIQAGTAAVEAAHAEHATLRVLGGVAVALRCPSADSVAPLIREFSDLDLATTVKHVKGTTRVLRSLGYEPNERFNAAHGESRLLFYAPDGKHVDVFVDRFELCHGLPLRGRLEVDPVTLPLADLLLTKLQVAKLSRKDVTDTVALLLDHQLTDDDEGLCTPRLIDVLASDWGWWRTATETLERLTGLVSGLGLDAERTGLVRERLSDVTARIEAAPKSLKWRARARVGERRPWREDPDELEA
jgi:hypothetical protein